MASGKLHVNKQMNSSVFECLSFWFIGHGLTHAHCSKAENVPKEGTFTVRNVKYSTRKSYSLPGNRGYERFRKRAKVR